MTVMRIVYCTCPSEDEAANIARSAVERDLAACAQVSGPVRSYYRWEGSLQQDSEFLLIIKTSADKFGRLREYIESLHSYEVPEIAAVPVTEVSEKYLRWLTGDVGLP